MRTLIDWERQVRSYWRGADERAVAEVVKALEVADESGATVGASDTAAIQLLEARGGATVSADLIPIVTRVRAVDDSIAAGVDRFAALVTDQIAYARRALGRGGTWLAPA